MAGRKSPRSKRPIQSEGSSHETSGDEISSGSKSTTNSRRSSPKKIKRANRAAIVQSINWKCSPHRIAEIIKKLTPRQVQWVKDMGFQSVLDMHPYKLPRRLLLWLVKHVDCKTKSLVLRNRRISILDTVQNILQFPAGEIQVQMPAAGNPRDKAFMKQDKFRPDKAGRGQTLAEEEKELLSYKNSADKDKFCLSFMEVLLCGYLASTTCYNINRSYLLGALSDMSQVPLMNWCHFAVDYLIRDIKDTRTKTVRNLNLQGCLHILIVMLADLVKNSILSAPPGTPRIKYITSDMIDQLETNCRKRDRDNEELFESLLDGEKLAKFPVIESNDICEEEESSSNAQADSTEENDAKPSRRCSRVMSNNQVNLIAEMIAIDERYSIERSKVMKNHETKLRKKLEELDSKRLNELKCLFKRVDKSVQKDADSEASDEN